MDWIWNDGGRIAAGLTPHHRQSEPASDCVCRAIAIAGDWEYDKVNDLLDLAVDIVRQKTKAETLEQFYKHCGDKIGSQYGLTRNIYKPTLELLGFEWAPACFTGRNRVSEVGQRFAPWPADAIRAAQARYPASWHLRRPWEPAPGRYVVQTVRHLCAVVDGELHDILDCRLDQSFGYFKQVGPIKDPAIAAMVMGK